MLKVIIVTLCVFFITASCKNVTETEKKLPKETVADTRYLKGSSHTIDEPLLNEEPKASREFYSRLKNFTAWTNEQDRQGLHQAIREAEQDGLNADDYNIEKLLAYENKIDISKEECIAYDLLLTRSFQKLVSHLFKGKLIPYKVHYDWALPGKSLNTTALLEKALKAHNVEETVVSCRPKHTTYNSLRNSLKFLRSLPDDTDYTALPANTILKLKDSGTVVARLKARLGYWKDLDQTSGNIFDSKTLGAVKRFQRRHGLNPDGVVKGNTVEALNTSLAARKQQVMANLERWRWFAYDFGQKALVINIAEYKLAVVEDSRDTIEVYRIVVGKPSRRTPVLHAVLNNLVVNPTWTVPPTILKEDLTPSAAEDRSYFETHNMKIYRHRDTIETTPEEWDPEKADHYRYVQGPGSNNALGLVKFNFKNSFSVYLHDTNHRELFRRGYRALSSGCVRVENPLKLASYVMDKEETGWDRTKLDSLIVEGETKNVGLKKETHVHQLYWTAWMDKGKVQFRDDIYNLDAVLYKKLRQ